MQLTRRLQRELSLASLDGLVLRAPWALEAERGSRGSRDNQKMIERDEREADQRERKDRGRNPSSLGAHPTRKPCCERRSLFAPATLPALPETRRANGKIRGHVTGRCDTKNISLKRDRGVGLCAEQGQASALLCSRRKAHQGARSSQQMPDRTWTGAGGAAGRRQFPAVKGIIGAHRATGRSPAQRRSSAQMRAALCLTTIVVHAASVAALHQAGGSGLRPPVLRVTGGGNALADPPVLRKIERGARTFLSGLTFSHITGLIRAGYEKPLEEEELPDLPDVDTAERHGASSRPRPPRRPSRAPHAATARRCQAADPRRHPDMRRRADPRGGLEGGRAGRGGAGAQQGPARGPHRPRSRRGGLCPARKSLPANHSLSAEWGAVAERSPPPSLLY
jgi:hypothetical protein